jgi:cell division protein FtsB
VSAEVRHRRAVVRLALTMLAFVAFLFAFVFPIRTLLAQRQETATVREKIELLREQNERLEEDAERLQSDAEVERLARERYNLVRPGETPYAAIPVPPEPAPTSTTAATGEAAP